MGVLQFHGVVSLTKTNFQSFARHAILRNIPFSGFLKEKVQTWYVPRGPIRFNFSDLALNMFNEQYSCSSSR